MQANWAAYSYVVVKRRLTGPLRVAFSAGLQGQCVEMDASLSFAVARVCPCPCALVSMRCCALLPVVCWRHLS